MEAQNNLKSCSHGNKPTLKYSQSFGNSGRQGGAVIRTAASQQEGARLVMGSNPGLLSG